MNADPKIYVAGHRGLAGSALVRRLRAAGLNGNMMLLRLPALSEARGRLRQFQAQLDKLMNSLTIE
jgi:nucleoside-diphosphate-sugar epimerase